jgi:hypothetical protein
VQDSSGENDVEIFGLRNGWEALTHLNIEDASSSGIMSFD